MGRSRSLNSTVVDQKQTGKDKILILRRMGKYLMHYPKTVVLALVLMLSSNLLALAGPMLSGKAIDAIEPGIGAVNFPRVFTFIILLLVFYALSAALSYILSVLMIHLSQKIIYA